jgi:hypothetical protein
MPCDQIRTIRQKWNHQTELEILAKALKQHGYKNVKVNEELQQIEFSRGAYSNTNYYHANTNSFTINDGQRLNEDAVITEYNRQNVETQAERYGWQIEYEDATRNKARIHRTL